ncbi:MAG: PDZ domain-containing protein [Immundisolibacter sp.]|uniref:PDZ domain-containing protein n=1 Tax=Immundisolibacter sp. TaxID=1934948 RepID=UPI003EE06FF8
MPQVAGAWRGRCRSTACDLLVVRCERCQIDDRAAQGPAEKTQIRRGDVIIAVDNTDLTSIRQFSDIVAQQKPGTPRALLVRRGEASLYVAVEFGAG